MLTAPLRLDAAAAARRLHLVRGQTPIPMMAQVLRARGAPAVVITGDTHDWLDTPQACGWLARPRSGPADHARRFDAALRQGWVAADAAVLARLPDDPGARDLPTLSCGDLRPASVAPHEALQDIGIYAIVDSAERVRACAAAGARWVQLRVKTERDHPAVREQVRTALSAAHAHGAVLVVNDHWRTALELAAPALHLGQEDWLSLGEPERALIAAAQGRGLQLGLSSHSLWELCRARGAGADLIACGPVWPTTTKNMPWRPQGLHNLGWWVRMAGRPVLAIGGILEAAQAVDVASTGAAAACVVRGLGENVADTLPHWQAAWRRGRQQPRVAPAARPAPSL